MIIEAVRAAGTRAPVGLVIAGDGRDRARVVRAAADNPHVHLLTPVSDRHEVARLFASCDALIHGCEGRSLLHRGRRGARGGVCR